MFHLGHMEIVVIFLVVILLFGGRKIPELGRALGNGITNFKKGLKDIKDETVTTNETRDTNNDLNKVS